MKYRYPLNGSGLSLHTERCNGCTVCVQVCPHGVFEYQKNQKKVAIIDAGACMGCGACALNCAAGALEVERGVGCAYAIINRLLGRSGACSCEPNSTCC